MARSDVDVSDIVVVADDGNDAAKLDQLAATLKTMGVTVESVDHDNGVIEGTAPTAQVAAIKKLPGVNYVRSVYNYVAESRGGDAGKADSDDAEDEPIQR
jgi:hypothetical protein